MTETKNVSVAVENALKLFAADKNRTFLAVQVSPAVRVSIGENFGLRRGEDGIGKVVAALTALGADVVVDTAIAFDVLTLLRVKKIRENKDKNQKMPVFSSECTIWKEYAKEKYPQIAQDLLPSATTVCAKLLKKYYGEQMSDKKVRVIAVELGEAKKSDVGADVVLTMDELAFILEKTGLNVRLLKKKPMAAPLGIASGAGYISALAGGDCEAIARCLLTEKTPEQFRKFAYSGLYGKQTRREAVISANNTDWKFAVSESLADADSLISDMEKGATSYDYVEIVARIGGAVSVGCDLTSEKGKMTQKLRALGLSYLDQSRAARSADGCSAAVALLKEWEALCRSGEADKLEEIEEIVEDYDESRVVIEKETPLQENVTMEAEIAVETIEENLAEEEILQENRSVEELTEEREERSFQRISKKDRRKMKRAKRKNGK